LIQKSRKDGSFQQFFLKSTQNDAEYDAMSQVVFD